MSNEIHAHQVLNLLHERPMAMQELREAVCAAFGEQAKFHTCKLDGLDLDALMAFFIEREKIVAVGDKWALNLERVCSH
ncbi:YecH family protein [Vibrio sp. Isolate25]|uniref:YecH family metal-binding protein n=1 Tax=unclassified Vibrio TaxID=2614977 RepID=UPI001EFC6BB0|nr:MULTISPECIES: YecH family metal-binding protein [unclassified Vibrio]MCG9598616.1 YecH family protein [Vibrio sp. Isolate25]MCG9680670.1 YecH family protein [Vibrio sp. Isolate24]